MHGSLYNPLRATASTSVSESTCAKLKASQNQDNSKLEEGKKSKKSLKLYVCHESLSLLESRSRANFLLPSQKHVQNNGSHHWNPTNSNSFVFHMFQSAKRILEAEHARKLPDSGEGETIIVMHVELS